MATIIELAKIEKLVKFDPSLEQNEVEWRSIYGLPETAKRASNDLPTWKSQWDIEETPEQQLDALLDIFCSGETLTFDRRFKPLTHLADGVWELKTADLRLFGWFPAKDCFIVGAIDLTFIVKNHNLYAGYAGQVGRARDVLDLDAPKFVTGSNPNDVVSNYSYP